MIEKPTTIIVKSLGHGWGSSITDAETRKELQGVRRAELIIDARRFNEAVVTFSFSAVSAKVGDVKYQWEIPIDLLGEIFVCGDKKFRLQEITERPVPGISEEASNDLRAEVTKLRTAIDDLVKYGQSIASQI